MSCLLRKMPRFTGGLSSAFGKGDRSTSKCPLELSLSLCDDANCKPNASFQDEKYPLHEEDGSIGSTEKTTSPSATEEEEQPEKAEEEKSEKEEKESSRIPKLSCNMSLEDEEKQEFCFTLYDFNGHGKVTKDDVVGLVRSIYDALGKKSLPKSGSRTIKVRLAISPDDGCEDKRDVAEGEPLHLHSERRASSESSRNNSMTTASTLLTDSVTVASKKHESRSSATNRKVAPHVAYNSGSGSSCKNNGGGHCSPVASRSRRFKSSSFQRQELIQWLRESAEKASHESAAVHDNWKHQQCQFKHSEHVSSSAHPRLRVPRPATPVDSPTCPYRLLDHTHDCGASSSSHIPSYLNRHHRQRSQSQEEEASPRHGPCRGPCRGSPGSHHHYRHRERDLERQRAMRQVASWIEREHLGKGLDHGRAGRVVVERHEHHHLHEHVHHHYHHYVD
ncbi:protein naked cuticle homolog 2-like isoform X2 [Ornithodoros turicata]|uniref:protein naked cuticle homolog 2-like isoform X2 n=1 Tax=Ornithodoros turicata TaxID=34597 RepID=UPI003138E7C1